MITCKKDMRTEKKMNLRGGEGTVLFTNLFDRKIPHMRLCAIITLEPGSSIGAHVHEREAEVFYVLEGEATVLDGGELATLRPGDAHLCGDGLEHSLMNRSQSAVKVLAVVPTVEE